MITKRSLNFNQTDKYAVALGCFDGVHIGHTRLIDVAHKIACQTVVKLAVFSFDEPPKNHFKPGSAPILTTVEEKQSIMVSKGVDLFVSVPFDDSIANLSSDKFFNDILLSHFNPAHVICGFNYRFGKNAEGSLSVMRSLCEENNIGFTSIPPVIIDGITVSSSEIRRLLAEGNVSRAAVLLGRPYAINGAVINGQHLGRTLGFPTLNQVINPSSAILRNGVYVSTVQSDCHVFGAITNVGTRPTVDGKTLCAETHIFNFDGNLYGKNVRVELLEFLRPEKKFDSIEELSEQVHKDIDSAKKIYPHQE